ncbi:MAG: protein kinase [Proteobacteria bacterium]|nr:protein kinase [Pseudomonadota bacterium]
MRITEPASALAAALAAAVFLAAAPARAEAPLSPGPEPLPVAEPELEEPTVPELTDDLTGEELKRQIEEAARRAGALQVRTVVRGASPLADAEARAERIDRQRPPPIDVDSGWLLPAELRGELWVRWGQVLESLPDHEGAQAAYARAIGLGREDAHIWRRLAHMRLRNGDFEGAEGALLAAIESDPHRSGLPRELGELYLLSSRPDLAVEALERASELAPRSKRAAGLLARARFEDDPTGPVPELFWSAWPDASHLGVGATVERGVRSLAASLPAPLREALATGLRESLVPGTARIGLFLAGLLALGLVGLRVPRGRGELMVSFDYPPELRGTFSVRLVPRSKKPRKRRPRSDHQLVLKGGASTRTEHHLVSRETQFRRLRPGSYTVMVEGILQDPDSEEVLVDPVDEQGVDVRNGETAQVEFDLQPRECLVDVKVLWDKRPAKDAAVAARGLPQSLRFARSGPLRLHLTKGKHTILVGCGDRVAEYSIEVDSFKPASIEIDLAASENVIFKGCPPAVEPYLHGDLSAAARALEREGQSAKAHLLLARLHREQGHAERAAEHFESAGRALEAARLRASLKDYTRAAALYEQAGDSLRAAEMFRRAGELVKAGDAFELARDLESAIACYKKAGNTAKWVSALERSGELFEAAQVAFQHDDRARGIRLLQQIASDDSRYTEACSQLADAFEREGHRDLATEALDRYFQVAPPGTGNPDLAFRLADLLEQGDQFERALEVLERLRTQEPTYPHVATRIETLRKKRSEQELSDSNARRTTAPIGTRTAPTAWIDEDRYQLIEEIGRGGMGVVFKARDTRLNRVVALKRLPENLRDHPKAIQLFLREAQASARLTHRNIVTVYDTDQTDGTFFITMELLKGRPLNVILKKKGRLTARDAARLGRQVASGLHYAHQQRVVHRDIKSANLFFTVDKTVKIMDFGLAKMMEEVRKEATVIGGTPFYMAPEQSAGESVDHLADIYAFGVTLFELATGQVPFSKGDVAYRHRHETPPDPRSVASDIPDELAELILEMIEKKPADRTQSADEVGRRLERLARS